LICGEVRKKKPENAMAFRLLAEKEGFEPPGQLSRPTDFESAPFDHSGISPPQNYIFLIEGNLIFQNL
jgi:hypothetical protein